MTDHFLPAPLIAIVGPTAAGKSAAGLAVAEALGGEIVSADSRQVYRGMDVGTAKVTPAEQLRVPHYLIDVANPDETMDLATFQALALAAIRGIRKRGRLALLVGGTGQYVRAIVEGWRLPHVVPDPRLRAELLAEAERDGPAALYARLAALDAEAAASIDARNVRRVVRALEVIQQTGQPFSAQRRKGPPEFPVLSVGLTLPRPALYERVDRRIAAMIAAGWADEVRHLLGRGYGLDLPAMSSLGYGEIGRYVLGEINLDEAIRQIEHNTRRYIRQQFAWFRPHDPAIHWFDLSVQPVSAIVDFVGQSIMSRQ